jgi:putative peptide zinc metalloprotease protein
MLGRRQLLDADVDEAALARLAAACQAARAGDRSLLRRRFAVTFPASWCAAAAARLRFAWRLWFVIPVVLVALAVEAHALGHLGALAAAARPGAHPWQVVPADVAGVWLLILVHELGHGLTCAHYGGTVTEIGVLWRFPMLIPYCKTDDMTLFGARRARVATAFAGMFTGLAALPALWAWQALSGPGSASRSIAAGLLLFTAITTLTNLTPFLGLDGYHMLTHALGYADLRADSQRFWFGLLFRRPRTGRALSRSDRLTHVAYGVATAAFFGGGYAVLSALWFHRLERWMPPALAGVVLGVETLLILALFSARRPRRGAGIGES